MKIAITVSNQMEQRANDSLVIERRLIRMPQEMRDALGLKTNTYLNLSTKTGEVVSLVVGRAFAEDALVNSKCAYVTSDVFSLLVAETEHHNVEKCETITLGCDPELFIVDARNSFIVPANTLFPKWGDPGSDGGLMEFRPLPSTSEETLTRNLWVQLNKARAIMNGGKNKYQGKVDTSSYVILARSHYKPPNTQKIGIQTAGYHIHFGLPKPMLLWNLRDVHVQMVKILDYYIGLPSILMEGETDNYRRTTTALAYGKPGDFRPGLITWEYRVPGGIIMKHPILSIGLLAIANVVMEDLVSRIKYCTDNYKNFKEFDQDAHARQLYPNLPPLMEVYRSICSPTLHGVHTHLAAVRSDLEKMIGYGKHYKNIENYFKMALEPHKVPENVEHNWRTFYEQGQQGALAVLQQPITAGAVR